MSSLTSTRRLARRSLTLTGWLSLSALAAGPALAGALDISGSVRARLEAIDGQFRPGKAESDAFLSFRTLIAAEYDFGGFAIGGELDDARGYLQKSNSSVGTSEVNALEPLQAYVAIDVGPLAGEGAEGSLKAGRFTMDIGSTRLVGRPDDSNFPPSYTGAVLDVTGRGGDRLVAFWTMPNTKLPSTADQIADNEVKWDRSRSDLQFFGAHLAKAKLGENIGGEVYAYRLAERDAPTMATRNRHLWTYGARLARKPGKGAFDFDLEAVLQSGSVRRTTAASDVDSIDVDAHFVHAEIGKQLAGGWSPRVSLHFDLASGDGSGADEYNRFDPLFGARRSEFGPTSLYGPLSRANIVSPGIRLEAKPSARFDVSLFGRLMWLEDRTDGFAQTNVRDAAGASGRFAGGQIEARARYWLVPKRLQLESGAAWLAKGRFLEDAPNAPATGNTIYGYSALVAKF